jgi:outer membrane protein assembly factor BamB
MNARTLPLLAAGLLACAVPARAADWPQWQGPDRDNVSKETGLLKSWPKNEPPKLLWTYQNTGVGFSGPAVIGDRLYVLGDRDKTEYVLALDVKTGKEVWAAEVGPYLSNGSTEKYGIGPRSTPTVDGDTIYAIGSQGTLVCVTTDGKPVWKVSLPQDLHGQMMSGWGWSESPLVDGDKVVCTPGGKQGSIAALDKHTGKVLWRTTDLTDTAAYSSVVVSAAGGVRQYVQLTGQSVVGVAAKDGKLLWRYPGQGFRTAMIPTPIVRGDYVYFTAGYGVGCDLLHLTHQDGTFKVESVYDQAARKSMENKHEAVVLVGDHVYGWTYSIDRGSWLCQEFKTGKVVWKSKELGCGSVTCADGRLYCYSEKDGTAVLVRAAPDGWKEDGRFQIPQQTKIPRKFSPSIWTHPVVADGHLYLRDQDLLFCFDVKDHSAE